MSMLMFPSEKTSDEIIQDIQLFINKRGASVNETDVDPYDSDGKDTLVSGVWLEGLIPMSSHQYYKLEVYVHDLGDMRHIKIAPHGDPIAVATIKERSKSPYYYYQGSNMLAKEIKKIIEEPGYTEKYSKSGCYIATCVYGSYDCPEVWTLRRYRDSTLARTWYGRQFIKTYYAVSPTLVKKYGDKSWFQKVWKNRLDTWVKRLNFEGYSNKPYRDNNC